jgi:hypothetical protein
MNHNSAIVAAVASAVSLIGAAIGAWIADAIQASRYDDPDWANLDAAFSGLFGGLLGLAGLNLGRWIIAMRTGVERPPVGWGWMIRAAMALLRLATAGIGVRLGYEAGSWTALIWDHWVSTAQYASEAHIELSNVWIVTACAWGGGLAILGYALGRRPASVASFIGAYLALHAVPYASPEVAELYWGPFPSSDFHALVLSVADFLTTCSLVLAFAVIGHWLARKLEPRLAALRRA